MLGINIIKQSFSNKYFNWILILITLIFSIEFVLKLFSKFEFYSSYFIRIIFVFTSIIAFISLISKKANGEKYSRFFIIIGLIMPSLIVFNLFLTDLVFYGMKRMDLLQNPILHLKFILGIILLIFSIKYTTQIQSTRIKEYGILISCVGFFLIVLILIKAIEPNFILDLNNVPIWKIVIKTIIGLLIFYFGYHLKSGKMNLKNSVFFSLLLMFIYGLLI